MTARKSAQPPVAASTVATWPIIGHTAAVSFLQRAAITGELSHAYLLIGPTQLGKATLAEHFAQGLLCEKPTGGVACQTCASCQQIAHHTHPDLTKLEPIVTEGEKSGATISIEEVRAFIRQLQLRPMHGTRRVGIVLDADQLGPEATHALLKTLEEPPGDTVLILTAAAQHRLPKTIFSRCQVMQIRPVATPLIADWLMTQDIPRDRARRLAALAMGRPGLAQHLAHDPSYEEQAHDRVQEIISLFRAPLDQRWKTIGRWVTAEYPVYTITSLGEQVLHDILHTAVGQPDQVIHQSFRTEFSRIAAHVTPVRVCELLTEIRRVDRYARAHVPTKLALEQFALLI
jgi:DNA polymerase-3 subunit delta'